MSQASTRPPRVFVSYAHEDRELKQELDAHLKVLKRTTDIEVWSDLEIAPGADWNREISRQILSADIILLLISVHFNASDFIWDEELAVAMRRHEEGAARVLPIILSECVWDKLPYAKLQALPPQGRPVTDYAHLDEALTEVARGIEGLLETWAGAER